MTADATLEIQKAVVARLKGDPGVAALVGTRVYDTPPQSPTWPLIEIGEDNAAPVEGTDFAGWECVLVIRSWSRKRGAVEAREMMRAVAAALHDAPIALDTQMLVTARLAGQNTVKQPDGVTTLGFQRFRFFTHA